MQEKHRAEISNKVGNNLDALECHGMRGLSSQEQLCQTRCGQEGVRSLSTRGSAMSVLMYLYVFKCGCVVPALLYYAGCARAKGVAAKRRSQSPGTGFAE